MADPFHSVANHDLREPLGSPWPHYALMILHILLLVGPPFPYRRAVATIGSLVLMAWCWRHPNFTKDLGFAQPFSIAWSTYLATLEKMVLLPANVTTEAAFWRIDAPAREATAYPSFGLQKLRWAMILIFNMRGIRWNYQVKTMKLPNKLRESRMRFVTYHFLAAIYYYIMTDFVSQAAVQIFYTNEDTLQLGAVNSKFLRIWDNRSLIWSFIRCLTFAMQPYYMLQLQYTFMAMTAVATRLSLPDDWPPCFGRLRETTSVRHFWGSYWHQTLRRMFISWTEALQRLCRIPKGTWMSTYSRLWVVFCISGAGHAASALILPSPSNITLQERTVGLFLFFVCQAGIITTEDAIKYLWRVTTKREGFQSNLFLRIMGYTWVVGTLWLSLPLAGDVFLHLRLCEKPPFSFSIWASLLADWVPRIRGYLTQ